MDFENLIKERFSVRGYKDTLVEEAKLQSILEAGRVAPTAVNKQPQMIYVIRSDEAKAKLDSVCENRYNAPLVLLVCADMYKVYNSPIEEGYNTSEMDCSIVGTHMMLEATNLGLGTCWIRNFDSKKVQQVFNLESNIKPVLILDVGYPVEGTEPSPRHFNRNSLDEEVKYL